MINGQSSHLACRERDRSCGLTFAEASYLVGFCYGRLGIAINERYASHVVEEALRAYALKPTLASWHNKPDTSAKNEVGQVIQIFVGDGRPVQKVAKGRPIRGVHRRGLL